MRARVALEHVHSYLVHPSKGDDDPPQIGGTSIPLEGSLGKMLAGVFNKAAIECDIDIVFKPEGDGTQNNPCRNLLVDYIDTPNVTRGRKIGLRLQEVTTNRSRLGLLFLMYGSMEQNKRLVISRFPADQGVIAEEDRDTLSVEFIERVFMKSAKAYKSAIYESDSTQSGFWDGRAVDHQIRGPKELSDYWIRDFLMSDLRTTGPHGTRRIAIGLRNAIRLEDDLETRQELIASTTILRGQHGRNVSGAQLVTQLGLSPRAAAAVAGQLPRPELMSEVFRFDREEFDKHVLYRFVELDNGGVLLAQDAEFDEVFEAEPVERDPDLYRFSTEGRIVDTRLKKTK